MVREGLRKGLCRLLLPVLMLLGHAAIAEEQASFDYGAGYTDVAAGVPGITIADYKLLYSELNGFVSAQDRRFRNDLRQWLNQSSQTGQAGFSGLLSKNDGGFSVAVGTDELSLDYQLRF